MGKVYDGIDTALAGWIAAQRLFFVATAPSGAGGHVNCSPKGGDTLRVLGPRELAFLDGGVSGVETISHLRDNGRICVMLCAFEGSARILRLHGRGEVLDPLHADFPSLLGRFPPWPMVRAYLLAHNQRGLDGLPALAPAEIEAAVISRGRPLARDSER